MNNILDAKVKNYKLVHEPDVFGFINNSHLNKNIKTLAAKAELKAEQDKIEKLQIYHSSLFTGQSYFINDESQNLLIFQSIFNTFTVPSGFTELIVA